MWVVVFAFTTISVLGVAALIVAVWKPDAANDTFGHIKDIFSILLPVIGTWVGVVLAFYFGKDNFEAAARSTASLVRQLTPDEKLRSISVKDAMLPIEKAITLPLNEDNKTILLKKDMIALLEQNNKERLPMLDAQGCVVYLAHKSTINDFIRKSQDAAPPNTDPSLADMLADTELAVKLVSFGTLRQTATLSETKVIMDNVAKCADVFITGDGTRKTKALGWITDSDVQKQATV